MSTRDLVTTEYGPLHNEESTFDAELYINSTVSIMMIIIIIIIVIIVTSKFASISYHS